MINIDHSYWVVVKSADHKGKFRIASDGDNEVKAIADNLDFSAATQIADEHTIVRRILMIFKEREAVTIEVEIDGTLQVLQRPAL